jgi:hypothetical protein
MNLYLFRQFDTDLMKEVYLSKDWSITESPKEGYHTISLSEAINTLADIGRGWTVVEADDIPDAQWA